MNEEDVKYLRAEIDSLETERDNLLLDLERAEDRVAALQAHAQRTLDSLSKRPRSAARAQERDRALLASAYAALGRELPDSLTRTPVKYRNQPRRKT